ncbi:MAG: hypothetical protein ACKOTA_01085, partial [Solirubrobacterales bacterium]
MEDDHGCHRDRPKSLNLGADRRADAGFPGLAADPDEAKPPSAAALRAAEREKKRSEAREPGVGSAIRPEIQALRAIAVATVVIF